MAFPPISGISSDAGSNVFPSLIYVQGNEQRLQAVVESSPLAIAELDLDGVARWWNRAAASLLGWDGPEAGQLRIPAVDDDATSTLARLWDCLLYTSPSPRDGLLSRMPSSA